MPKDIVNKFTRRSFFAGIAGVVGTAALAPAVAKAAVAERAPGIVTPVASLKKDLWAIHFGPVTVPPATTMTIQTQPQCLFRGDILVRTGDKDLEIVGIFVGKKSQLPWEKTLSDSDFSAGGVIRPFDTCDPALFITLQIKNPTLTSRVACYTMIGYAVL